MSRRLKPTLTHTLDLQQSLEDALTQAHLDLSAWRPASATPQGQSHVVEANLPSLTTFCPTFQALRALNELWEPYPYTMQVRGFLGGYLATLTRNAR